MRDSLYVALSAQMALERRLDTIADNVANASTVGFRATGVKFEDVVSGAGQKSVSFASSGKTYLSGAHGAMTETGNPFDFAIQGDAWFAIDTPAGTVMTRDGRFSMNENGELMSVEGHPVLDAGGAPIQLDPRNGPPKAGADGSLRQNEQLVGSIGLYNFDPGENFVRYGNSGIVPARTPEPVTDRSDVGIAQGFVEESNVNPVLEMTRLIMVQRAFENTAAMMRQTDSSTDEAIKTLGSKS
ncbi:MULTISPECIES: flagellar basal-body rod protein FlgF [unclassified Mesorhizobium]|uniref:flagellar basal-body rod protein FlgF n=1 Tax=unclassified Mesorhizobium TaxID=325217 RepID=UPI000FDCC1E5|nr:MULTISPECIES: flagellar basal-body rod protein FlgF [unclassified Mesorhizobium]TGR48788.1 flagellar basal-body rod protein FlgF [bacterium M00.F.Ca.ET.199.01.1.1]TGU37829.1 flagellar basal-body rod protein FlgF [bacterium M00.F.Ca.ET.156.01.1.1]TGV88754.1 flagellar basal-body rod protein FlgF [Mesorhizobium sp. M00.F.Ca.ET.149.01.1.1]TGR30476.1 flagellar basal-body rod protein FlgF [Mesorhizobium sp. M8A.F.Ca.ET.202.01.1.1]TGR31204.1 flagellar basal-body rod protein FlgF [Mesorhizobium sp.